MKFQAEFINPYRYGFNGKEKDDELKGQGNSLDYGARINDPRLGRWLSVDPLAAKYPWQSPYVSLDNNPIKLVDPTGMGTDDFVQRKDGSIYWDKNANSQATTKKGEKYLGKELTFKFNSFIDGKLWDGPNPPVGKAEGDKLTSTIKLKATENDKGELIGLTAKVDVLIGETPVGEGKDYYPGPGGNNNIFAAASLKKDDGTFGGFALNFEQHASVSSSEELGLNLLGYKIVDVGQKLEIRYGGGGNLKITSYTDIFPSATLDVNGNRIMYYPQPSFEKTHGVKLNLDKKWGNGTSALDYGYYPSVFYKR